MEESGANENQISKLKDENLQLLSMGAEAFARLEALQMHQVEKERELSELKAENAELREITSTDEDSL